MKAALYINHYAEDLDLSKFSCIEPVIFSNNILHKATNFPTMLSIEMWAFDGAVIALDMKSARYLLEISPPKRKFLWLDKPLWQSSKMMAVDHLKVMNELSILTEDKKLAETAAEVFRINPTVVTDLRDIIDG